MSRNDKRLQRFTALFGTPRIAKPHGSIFARQRRAPLSRKLGNRKGSEMNGADLSPTV
jgi:hypothetical protein